MGSIKIVYSELKDAWKAADKAADYCEDYAAEIRRKVTNKINSFSGTDSNYTNSAAGYAAAKIRELDSKATKLRSYSNRLENLYNEAKDTDRSVKSYLKLEGRDFRDSHDMHVSRIAELFVNFFVTMSNSNPVSKWLKDMHRRADEWRDALWEDIKYWYHCDGGKYWVKIAAAFALTLLAIMAAVAAWPVMIAALSGTLWAALVGIAGFVGAVIAAFDAYVDLMGNIAALAMFKNDPAWAARYDSYNSLAGWLEKHRFDSRWMNKFSMIAATAVNITKSVCAVMNIANLIKNTANFIKGYKAGTNWLKWKSSYHAATKSDASVWTKMKFMFRAIKVDYGTVTDAATLNQFQKYLETYDSFCKTLKGFTDATKGLKTFSKFIIKWDEKGLPKATVDYFKGKTTYIKEIDSNVNDIIDARDYLLRVGGL